MKRFLIAIFCGMMVFGICFWFSINLATTILSVLLGGLVGGLIEADWFGFLSFSKSIKPKIQEIQPDFKTALIASAKATCFVGKRLLWLVWLYLLYLWLPRA
jgi:hypothetical protein